MSMDPWVSYRAGTWLIDECQIAYVKRTHLFCLFFFIICLTFNNLSGILDGYHGYQFYAALLSKALLWFELILSKINDKRVESLEVVCYLKEKCKLGAPLPAVAADYFTVDKNSCTGQTALCSKP